MSPLPPHTRTMNLIPRITPLLAALGAAAVLGGCSSGVPLDQKAPVETQTATPVGAATGSATANAFPPSDAPRTSYRKPCSA